MLINFSVENFRSFGDEQTLSLIASSAQTGHEAHCVPIPASDQQALRASVIYGANAAGKSNLVKAIDFARDLIIGGAGPRKRIALNQFRFTEDAAKPSSFEFRFMVAGRVFVYGFDITKEEVNAEWLSATTDSGRESDLFSRSGKKIEFGDFKKFGEEAVTSSEALKALKLLGVRPNQLLLNKIVDLDPEKRGTLLHNVVWWFTDCLVVISPDATFAPIIDYLDADAPFRDFASQFLGTIGTGIGGLGIEQTAIKADQLPKGLIESLQSINEVEVTPIAIGAGMSLQLDPNDPATVIRRNLASTHRVGDKEYNLPFQEESDGTQRFLNLLPALFRLHTGCQVFVIDELDRSLHPLLAHALIKFFVESCPGSCQQLIVTTHETHLLDLDLLRRDEIWFVEKDERQQSHLYSLTSMSVRKDLRIEKSYLQGRFGAVPFVGGMDKLRELVECRSGLGNA